MIDRRSFLGASMFIPFTPSFMEDIDTQEAKRHMARIVDLGIDRNLLVHDGDAQPGELTKHLLDLMDMVMLYNGFHIAENDEAMCARINTIYLPPHIKLDTIDKMMVGKIKPKTLPYPVYEYMIRVWDDRGATMAKDDKFLVVAVDESHDKKNLDKAQVLLGSF